MSQAQKKESEFLRTNPQVLQLLEDQNATQAAYDLDDPELLVAQLLRTSRPEDDPGLKLQRELTDRVQAAKQAYLDQLAESKPDLRTCTEFLHDLDTKLALAESFLQQYRSDLVAVTQQLFEHERESNQLREAIESKAEMSKVVKGFADQVLVTSELSQKMTSAPISLSYLSDFENLSVKLERCRQPGIASYPSVEASRALLEKLIATGHQRIEGFILETIKQTMTWPQPDPRLLASYQIDHTNLLKTKPYYAALCKKSDVPAVALRQAYLAAARETYQTMAKAFQKMYLKPSTADFNADDTAHLLGHGESAAHSSTQALMTNLIRPNPHCHRAGILSLNDRDKVLSDGFKGEFENSSVYVEALHNSVDKSIELYFKAQQTVVLEAHLRELRFLNAYFGQGQADGHQDPRSQPTVQLSIIDQEGVQSVVQISSPSVATSSFADLKPVDALLVPSQLSRMVAVLFQPVLRSILQSVQEYACHSTDAIGLLLMLILNEMAREQLRAVSQLRLVEYFDELRLILWSGTQNLLELHLRSLNTISVESLVSAIPRELLSHPHYILRRCAEFGVSLMVLHLHLKKIHATTFPSYETLVDQMKASIVAFLENMSHRIETVANCKPSGLMRCVFLINNYDLLITVWRKRSASQDDLAQFKTLLNREVENYLAITLDSEFSDFTQFIRTIRHIQVPLRSKSTPLHRDQLSELDLSRLEATVSDFTCNWEKKVQNLKSLSQRMFTNFQTGTEILKQTLMQLLKDYTSVQNLVHTVYPSSVQRQSLPWIKSMMSTLAITNEIKALSGHL